MATNFVFNEEHRLLICTICERSIPPSQSSQKYHLRQKPHRIHGQELRTLVDLFQSYGRLNGPEQLMPSNDIIDAIPHLRIYQIYVCCLCDSYEFTQHQKGLATHISVSHQIRPKDHKENVHWRRGYAQTFYSEKKHVDYFEVRMPDNFNKPSAPHTLDPEIQKFFDDLESQRTSATQDMRNEQLTIDGFEEHKSEVVPWLERTGIAEHLKGLPIDRILDATSISILPDTADPLRGHILEATDVILEAARQAALPGPFTEMSRATQLTMCQVVTETGAPRPNNHAFNPKKHPDTLCVYLRYWKQFLVYYLDVVFGTEEAHAYWWPLGNRPDGASAPNDGFHPSEAELDLWKDVMVACEEESGKELKDTLNLLLPRLFMAMLCHNTGCDPFRSPLISYAAMLAVKRTTTGWKEPGDFNSHLSGIIWVSQLLLFYYCVRTAAGSIDEHGEPTQSTNHCVREVFGANARQDSETPLGYLLNWRDFIFAVSRETMRVREAIWDVDQRVLTYGDTVLALKDVSKLLQSEYGRAHAKLYEDLLFGAKDIPRMQAHMFRDDMKNRVRGVSLLDLNERNLPKSALEHQIKRSAPLTRMFVQRLKSGIVRWSNRAIDHYESVVQEFLKHLLVLVHVGGGQPLRSPEILSAKWKNTQNQVRSLYVLHNRVMLRVNYHKGLEVTGRTKDNMRFLPAPIGDLLLDFLVHVQPLRQEFFKQVYPKQVMSPFLWVKDRQVWEDTKVTKAMESGCSVAGIPRLHVSNWRQMTVAIVKAKFPAHVQCFDVDPGSDNEDDTNNDMQAMHLQRNHSSITANMAYANQHSFGGMSDEFIHKSLRASQLWSGLFHIETQLGAEQKRRRSSSASDLAISSSHMIKRIAGGRWRERPKYTASELLAAARGLFDDDKMQWKSTFQSWALETIMSGTEMVVVVLPTGAGKSLLFMLPASLSSAETTVLILPLVALRGDMLRRLSDLGIRTTVWTTGSRPSTSLVLVSAEAACTADFRAYALSLIACQKLDRIVVDECHLTITARDYRKSMVDLGGIRTLATQFVYLTATLPPCMEAEFNQRNYLVNPKVIRASTNRPNLRYRIMRNTSGDSLLTEAARMIRYYHWQGLNKQNYGPDDKVVVYCCTIQAVDELAELLGCVSYTSQSGNTLEKTESVRRWTEDPSMPYIVATSAFGAGIDYAHVRRVWHIDAPRSIIDFAQESGRAGRDGRPAYSTTFLSSSWRAEMFEEAETRSPRGAMYQYLGSGQCLRFIMSGYFDAEDQQLMCDLTENPCQNCIQRQRVPNGLPLPVAEPLVRPKPVFVGASLVLQQMRQEESQLARFKEDLAMLKNTCTLCRQHGRNFEHLFNDCDYRFPCIRHKGERMTKGPWLKQYTACYWCLLPQGICGRPASCSVGVNGRSKSACEFQDLVLPFCYSVFESDPAGKRFYEEYGVVVTTAMEFFDWIGKPTMFAGLQCINGVTFMAKQLADMKLY